MTTHDRVSVNANGAAVQIYFKKEFARDSAFPFDAGDDAVAYVTPDGGLHLVPLDSLVDADLTRDYPLSIDAPPPEAFPPDYRTLLSSGHSLGHDGDRVCDTEHEPHPENL